MPEGGHKISVSYNAKMMSGTAKVGNAGMFAPGEPVHPVSPQPVRLFDFAPGSNMNYTPRSGEAFGFPELRAFANVELVRLAIETRKNQIERLDWRIKSKDGRKKRTDADARIRKMEKFFRKPDGVTPFASWLRLSLE